MRFWPEPVIAQHEPSMDCFCIQCLEVCNARLALLVSQLPPPFCFEGSLLGPDEDKA